MKWVCKICGYVHEGPEAPEKCPICKAPASKFEKVSDGVYYAYFDGLDASMMRKSLYLTVYSGDTAVSNTVQYSIASYAYEKKDSTIPGLADLVKAMMKYGDAASVYAS